MDAGKTMIGGIFQYGRLLEVPFYQRAYVWDTTQWSRFLDDMAYISRTKRPFFFGSIILKEESLSKEDGQFVTQKLIVTDGQQRLTTLMIFMKVLAIKTGNMGGFDAVFCVVDGSPKLLHGKYDHDDFLAVMSKKDLEPFQEDKDTSQILLAFNFFAKEMIAEEYDWQAICQYSLFVNISLLENEDEQQVFDTINTPGVSLSTAELLKNYLFRKDNTDAFERDWVAVFEKDDEQRNYWTQDIFVGRNKRSLIDLFFDAFFQIMVEDKTYSVKAEDKIAYRRVDRLSISIKEFIGSYCGGDKQKFISNMAYYAETFASAIRPEMVDTSIPPTSGIDRINVVMFGLSTTTIMPYVLFVERNVKEQEAKDTIYDLLEAYIMRRIVCHATTKNYNRLFTSLILNRVLDAETLRKELISDENVVDATTYIPGDNELQYNFRNAKLVNLQTKGILYMLESRIRPAMSAVSLFGFNNYSLEHLMPKKWRNHWQHPATEQEKAIRDSDLLTLGNLAIIPKALNSSIRDADWITKLAGKGNKEGLKSCAAGLYTMDHVLDKTEWNEELIHERAQWLYEKAAEIWHIDGITETVIADPEPVSKVESDLGSDEFNTDSNQQTSNRKPSEEGTIYAVRRAYWEFALKKIKERHGSNGAFRNVNTSKEYWLNGYIGLSGFSIGCEMKMDSANVLLVLQNRDRSRNESAYHYLLKRKEQIEEAIGEKLDWWSSDKWKAFYINKSYEGAAGIYRENTWEAAAVFHAEWSKKFYDVIVPLLYEWSSTQ